MHRKVKYFYVLQETTPPVAVTSLAHDNPAFGEFLFLPMLELKGKHEFQPQ
jgi:hypothetical protein